MINIDSILKFFEQNIVKSNRQYKWDNSGKQIYIKNSKIRKIGFALDPSFNVIDQAIKEGCELLITHHPLFFNEIKSISSDSLLGEKTIKAIKSNLNIISYHTSLDLADYNLNDYLAELLNANIIDFFIEEGNTKYFKFAVFVPISHRNLIIDAIEKAGAGNIGNYSKCTFTTEGIGTFLPNEKTKPFIGQHGKLEEVKEIKIETIVDENKLSSLINNVINAHPYEEIAYDVYPLNINKPYGLGRICELKEDITLNDFLKNVSSKLKQPYLRHNASTTEILVKRFAIVTGSGASLWKNCIKQNIKVLLTSDMKHHDALDASEAGITIIDAGHFATERIFMEHLANIIEKELKIKTIIIDEEETIKQWGS